MAFFDEGKPRWETCAAGGTGGTAVDNDTPRYSAVVGSRAVGDKYATIALTSAATDRLYGSVDYTEEDQYKDPFDLSANYTLTRIKRGEKLRFIADAAYTAADFGKGVTPSGTNNGQVEIVDTGGYGRIDGGETVGTVNYLDVWFDEADILTPTS